MERTEVLAARLDLLRWARAKGPEAMAAAEHLAEQLYAHGGAEPPRTRRGLVRALEELREAAR